MSATGRGHASNCATRWVDDDHRPFPCDCAVGREQKCQAWGESGVESQELCPACGHYALFHVLDQPCEACEDIQGQRIADAVRATAREQT